MDKRIEALVEDFSLFDDWEGRYAYLIDLGKTLPLMDDGLKADSTLVPGCTSRVWMVPKVEGGRFSFLADSDAHIVRGLIGILMKVYQDRPLAEIAGIDMKDVFRRLGLDNHLSPNRRSGFFAIVERIRAYG